MIAGSACYSRCWPPLFANCHLPTFLQSSPSDLYSRNTAWEATVKRSIAFALAAFVGLALAPTSAGSQEVTLRLHSFLPPVANPVKHFMVPWAEKVEKDSKGRIKVQVYPSMQLGGKAEQLLTQVRDGVVDVVWTLPGFTHGDAQARDLRIAVPAPKHSRDRDCAAGLRRKIHAERFRALPCAASALSRRRPVHDQGPDQQDRGLRGHEAAFVFAHECMDPRSLGCCSAASGVTRACTDAQQRHGQRLDPAVRDRAVGQDAGSHQLFHNACTAAAEAEHGDLHVSHEQAEV